MTITDLYNEISQLRELEQQIKEFQAKHKNSPCIFSEEMQNLLDNRIDELKTKIAKIYGCHQSCICNKLKKFNIWK